MTNKKILLIDDDDVFLLLTERTLKKVPFLEEIKSLHDAEQANDFLSSQAQQKDPFPDAIFVDINMPGMSGLDFAQLYNQKFGSSYPQTKLVMLSSSLSRKEKAKALEIPAVVDFMQKPLTAEKLNKLFFTQSQ